MLDTLILILTLLLKAASLWFLAVALFALRKPKRYAVCAPRTRFACLVAARNEEAVIGALVESLKKQDYPDALYDIFVIPNNCTDDTEAAALCAGAKIFRCFEPVRCKGDALHEAVAWLLPQRYDAFCVFDADNVADERFLARMNDAFCAGAQVCKGAMRESIRFLAFRLLWAVLHALRHFLLPRPHELRSFLQAGRYGLCRPPRGA